MSALSFIRSCLMKTSTPLASCLDSGERSSQVTTGFPLTDRGHCHCIGHGFNLDPTRITLFILLYCSRSVSDAPGRWSACPSLYMQTECCHSTSTRMLLCCILTAENSLNAYHVSESNFNCSIMHSAQKTICFSFVVTPSFVSRVTGHVYIIHGC